MTQNFTTLGKSIKLGANRMGYDGTNSCWADGERSNSSSLSCKTFDQFST
ncbi:hypothetical protein Patl1_35126 [Pistacia atlantica]|uniref:Uncharacterized protein n=1 Tax=Pistacia atlantica TaxID=434234 RepID=A0ACC0ZQ46_9ROSI|nr:hypothetical protein Patl1_35126 [Pistacia atlantica]